MKKLLINFNILCFVLFNCNCQQSITIKDVQISYLNTGNKTDFLVSSSLGNGIKADNAWLAIGFNNEDKMV